MAMRRELGVDSRRCERRCGGCLCHLPQRPFRNCLQATDLELARGKLVNDVYDKLQQPGGNNDELYELVGTARQRAAGWPGASLLVLAQAPPLRR